MSPSKFQIPQGFRVWIFRFLACSKFPFPCVLSWQWLMLTRFQKNEKWKTSGGWNEHRVDLDAITYFRKLVLSLPMFDFCLPITIKLHKTFSAELYIFCNRCAYSNKYIACFHGVLWPRTWQSVFSRLFLSPTWCAKFCWEACDSHVRERGAAAVLHLRLSFPLILNSK